MRLRKRRVARHTSLRGQQTRHSRGWIGRDVVHARLRGARRLVVPLIAATLLSLLALAVLRIDVIKQRYALQAAVEELGKLEAERQVLAAERRRQREPIELEESARALGFAPPLRVIDLAHDATAPAKEPAAQLAFEDSAQLATNPRRKPEPLQ